MHHYSIDKPLTLAELLDATFTSRASANRALCRSYDVGLMTFEQWLEARPTLDLDGWVVALP